MSDFVYVIVTMDGMVTSLECFTRANVLLAEQAFVKELQQHLANFADYTDADVQACVEDGYEGFGNDNSIQLHWADT